MCFKNMYVFNNNLNQRWTTISPVLFGSLITQTKSHWTLVSLPNLLILCDCPILENCQILKITNRETAVTPIATTLRYVTFKIVTIIVCLLIIKVPV